MNRISVAALALALSGSSAVAENSASNRAPTLPAPPVFSWTGFYAGLNAGYGWDASPNVLTTGTPLQTGLDTAFTDPAYYGYTYAAGSLSHSSASALAATGIAGVDASGGVGGGQIGYNHQINRFVIGLEADIQSAGIRGRGGFLGGASSTVTTNGWTDAVLSGADHAKSLDWLGTVRGRLGYLLSPTLLAYATGGLAYGGATAHTRIIQGWSGDFFGNALQSSGGVGGFSDTLVGWTAGGGLEWMFSPNVSVKGEYLYYDLGSARWASGPLATSYTTCAGYPPCSGATVYSNSVQATSRTRFDGHIVRAGLNYHFSPFGASPAAAAPSPIFGWTGVYAGLNAGYAWDASPEVYTGGVPVLTDLGMGGLDWPTASALSATGTARASGGGGLAGGQIGYNQQYSRFVAGVEADLQSVHLRGRGGFLNGATTSADVFGTTYADTVFTAAENEKTVDWLGTVRGRLGYLVTPALLAYGTGGLAYGGATAHSAAYQIWSGNFLGPWLRSSGATGRFSETLVVWTAGGGVEWMFASNLSLKGEYLYYDLGEAQFASSPLMTNRTVGGTAYNMSVHTVSRTRFDGHIARAGLNYHFDLGAPNGVAEH